MNQRVAIVSGAGTGIGAATAHALSRRGFAVGLIGRRVDRLEAVAAELASTGGTGFVLPGDLEDPLVPARLIDQALGHGGRIDALVNNAAIFEVGAMADLTIAEIDRTFAINVRSIILMTQAVLPALRRARSPAIVNLSSPTARLARPGMGLYGLTKAAVDHLTRQLAVELAADGVRVNAVSPGPTATESHAAAADDLEAHFAWLATQTLVGRVAQPDEVAWWVALLCDNESDWVTGTVMNVDGGRSLRG